MNYARWIFATLAPIALLLFGLVACAPEGGGQTGSELSCVTDEDCTRNLGDGYVCGEIGECLLMAGVCPTTCDDWCPLTATCDVPDGCENPGCRCPDGVCDEPTCPTTCEDWCPMTAACEVPDGCENPGCRCADGNCNVKPACPETCEDWCPLTAACEVPDGCENPGCRCADGICDDPGAVCPTTCGDWCPMAADCTLPLGCDNPGCGCPVGICE